MYIRQSAWMPVRFEYIQQLGAIHQQEKNLQITD